jgi:tetratricopeptide (TPR) repeat protein
MSDTPNFHREVEAWVIGLLPKVPQGIVREALLFSLGNIYNAESRLVEAIPIYREALVSAEAREDWHNCSAISYHLGIALRNAAYYPDARDACYQALRSERRADRHFIGRLSILCELVRLLLCKGEEGQWRRARKHANRLVRLSRAYYQAVQADPTAADAESAESAEDLLMDALEVRQYAEFRLGDYTAMLDTCTDLIEFNLRYHLGDRKLARDLVNRAVCLTHLGEREKAENDLRQCQRIFHDYRDFAGESNVVGKLASLADDDNDPTRAVEFACRAVALCHLRGPGGLLDAALAHYNLAVYLAHLAVYRNKLLPVAEAVFPSTCAILIYTLIGQERGLSDSRHNLRIWLQVLPPDLRRAAWPTAAAIWGTYPELAQTFEARGAALELVQQWLDRLWHELSPLYPSEA